VKHLDWNSEWPAPAKLNLFLHVVGRRADGYHLLQTVFRFIDRCDTLRFSPRADGQIELATPIPGVPADSDLTVRAARLLQQHTGCRRGATIYLDKRLPMGGGLGGGSSDAATVLLALNHLWQTGVPRAELERLGLTLGADVPVFVHGRSGLASGIGERIEPAGLSGQWYVVLWPGVGLATGEVFQAPELTRNTPTLTMSALPAAPTRNDLQPVAIRLCPVIGEALAWLAGHGPARMTGSGSAVFATVADQATARAAAAASPWPAWAVQGVAVSPLHRALGIAPG